MLAMVSVCRQNLCWWSGAFPHEIKSKCSGDCSGSKNGPVLWKLVFFQGNSSSISKLIAASLELLSDVWIFSLYYQHLSLVFPKQSLPAPPQSVAALPPPCRHPRGFPCAPVPSGLVSPWFHRALPLPCPAQRGRLGEVGGGEGRPWRGIVTLSLPTSHFPLMWQSLFPVTKA